MYLKYVTSSNLGNACIINLSKHELHNVTSIYHFITTKINKSLAAHLG